MNDKGTIAEAVAADVEPFIGRWQGVNELIGQRRHRVFAYSAYLDILSEGAQPL